MSTLPVTRVCRRCAASFHTMPGRAARLPGAGELCPACRFLGPEATSPRERAEELGDLPPPRRTWPCRVCGRHSANRFYCPEHHEALSDDLGLDPGGHGVAGAILPVALRSSLAERDAVEEARDEARENASRRGGH